MNRNTIYFFVSHDQENFVVFIFEKNQFHHSMENKIFVSPIQKFISLNTILSKNLNILIALYCFDNIGYDYNLLKKFEVKLEIGKIISFSFGVNNYGKIKIFLN